MPRVNLAVNDTAPLPFVGEGKKSAYYGGGRDRLAHTDTSTPVALRVTEPTRSRYKQAVIERFPDIGYTDGSSVVLRALVEAYIAGDLVVERTEYPPRGQKFPLGEKVVFLNCLVPSRVKRDFDDAVAAKHAGAEITVDPADVLREIVYMFNNGLIPGLIVIGDGKSRFAD